MIRVFEQKMNKLIQFNLFTDDEIEMISNFLLWTEQNVKEKSEYIIFIEKFNEITGKKYRPTKKSRKAFYDNVYVYSLNDKLQAVKNCLSDNWVKQNFTVLTPQWILKDDNIAKYLNFKQPKSSNVEIKNFNEKNYEQSGL